MFLPATVMIIILLLFPLHNLAVNVKQVFQAVLPLLRELKVGVQLVLIIQLLLSVVLAHVTILKLLLFQPPKQHVFARQDNLEQLQQLYLPLRVA